MVYVHTLETEVSDNLGSSDGFTGSEAVTNEPGKAVTN